MNQKFCIVVDSTMIPSMEAAQKANVFVQPLYVIKDQVEKKDFLEISAQEIYQQLRQGALYQTSQPSVGDFAETYESLIAQGYQNILVLTISEILSGTYQSATIAAQQFPEVAIKVINTKLTAAMCWLIVEEIIEFEKQHSFDEVVKYASTAFDGLEVVAYVGNIEYLKRGGRLSAANAMLANLLKIRPILQIRSGEEIKVIDKTRSLTKAFQRLVEIVVSKNPKRIVLLTSDEENQALVDKFKPYLTAVFPNLSIDSYTLCSVIGCHVGPEIIALMYQV